MNDERLAIAECERCGGKWLIKTEVDPDLLEGACLYCVNDSDSDVERPLTFRAPTPIEVETGIADEIMTAWVDDGAT